MTHWFWVALCAVFGHPIELKGRKRGDFQVCPRCGVPKWLA